MSERTPWWKSFLGIRKTSGPKEASFDPDFNPFTSKPEKAAKDPLAAAPGPPAKAPAPQTHPAGNKEPSTDSSGPLGEDTYDDSHLESVFNEQSCRRNMRVSRSGRFKEKRRVRSTLPIEEQQQQQQDKNGPRREDQR